MKRLSGKLGMIEVTSASLLEKISRDITKLHAEAAPRANEIIDGDHRRFALLVGNDMPALLLGEGELSFISLGKMPGRNDALSQPVHPQPAQAALYEERLEAN